MPATKVKADEKNKEIVAQKTPSKVKTLTKIDDETPKAKKQTAKPIEAVKVEKTTIKPAAEKAEKTTKQTATKIEAATTAPTKAEKPLAAAKHAKKATTRKKILFAASECQPFVASGGLADVIGSLPQSLPKDFDVRVVMPLYNVILDEYVSQMKFLGHFNLSLSWRNQYCGVFEMVKNNVTYYFIDNKYYFGRNSLYGFADDCERFAFFSKAVLAIMPVIGFFPDIVHCHDWQTALTPVYLRTLYKDDLRFKHIKTLFCIHNIEYQGKCSCYDLGGLLGLDVQYLDMLKFGERLNFIKGAIVCCDKLSTVSPTYAQELCYSFFAHGLENIIVENNHKFVGILNGIDTVSYNPATDTALYAKFDKTNILGKTTNKIELQRMLGLPIDKTVPIIAMVSRLVAHKGLDLLRGVIHEILKERVQFVVIGKGDSLYETFLTDMEHAYNNKMRVAIAFNSDLARKIYASADFFLMPSKTEPCGLAQMISCRYGTVPIVRKTGGLADSIKDFDNDSINGNGYVFENYNAHEMLAKINSAISNYYQEEKQNLLINNCLSSDFSWAKSALKYAELYLQM